MFKLMVCTTLATAVALPKVLVLHGGGGNGAAARSSFNDITTALSSQYEFFYPSAPGGLWVLDPPGGKSAPTTDPNWGCTATNYLNQFVEDNTDDDGDFVGIMGYSQGSMFTAYYLSVAPTTFQFAAMFCGYVPDTHLALKATECAAAPFATPALLFSGVNDIVITPAQTNAQAALFTDPVRVSSSSLGHTPPGSSDGTFASVVAFLTAPTTATSALNVGSPGTSTLAAACSGAASPATAPTCGNYTATVDSAAHATSPLVALFFAPAAAMLGMLFA